MDHDVAGERTVDLVRVRYVDVDGREHVLRLEQAVDVPFEDARMARAIPSYRGQRHTPGRYWSATRKNRWPAAPSRKTRRLSGKGC